LSMLNPIHHSASPGQVATYQVEPYVVAADVYAMAPHTGRGGWTWYTGFRRLDVPPLAGNHVGFADRRQSTAPDAPPAKELALVRHPLPLSANQLPHHRQPVARGASPSTRIRLDGQDLTGETIPLQDDRRDHLLLFQSV